MNVLRSLALVAALPSAALFGACGGASGGNDLFASDAGDDGANGEAGNDATSNGDASVADCPTEAECTAGTETACSTPGAQCNVSGFVGVFCMTSTNGQPAWVCFTGAP